MSLLDNWITSKQVSKHIGISYGTLMNSRSTGQLLGRATIPYTKLGNRVLYKPDVVDKWCDELFAEATTTAQQQA